MASERRPRPPAGRTRRLLVLLVAVAAFAVTVFIGFQGQQGLRGPGPSATNAVQSQQAGATNPSSATQPIRTRQHLEQQQVQQRSAVEAAKVTLQKHMKETGYKAVGGAAVGAAQPGAACLPTVQCRGTLDNWCVAYQTQAALPPRPVPRGDKDCPKNCSGVGVCHHDFGTCYCPAGTGGPDCSSPRKRPCWRMNNATKRDMGWNLPGWIHSRCAGICDDDLAMCYCPPETKHGHVFAPAGSPLGTPPVKRGRPMFWCQPASDKDGNKVHWGAVQYNDLFGDKGWCNGDPGKETFRCPCRLDGLSGLYCELPNEQYCPNQCSGHGACKQGFCKCRPGWYGHDCSRKRAGLPLEPGAETTRPWLKTVMLEVQAASPASEKRPRKRPLIYVYDITPQFGSDLLQYRIERGLCSWRSWTAQNVTYLTGGNYNVESILHERMLSSEHRTFDPEEADFFYVPAGVTCIYDFYGWNAIPGWPILPSGPDYVRTGTRPFASWGLMRETWHWLNSTFPWVGRRGGKDHIWFNGHDEGMCAAPKEVWPGIMLSHWGRNEMPHKSLTQYDHDVYHADIHAPEAPGGWVKESSKTHPCHDPDKDLVLPAFKPAYHFQESPFLKPPGKASQERPILFFFRGDIFRHGDGPCRYSRCTRQTLYKIFHESKWREKYNARFGNRTDVEGDYSTLLTQSRFCLVMQGDGWSARFEDAVLHGCIPVILMDHVHVALEEALDIETFSLRIPFSEVRRLPEMLLELGQEKETGMRARLESVWHRYVWRKLPLIEREFRKVLQHNGVVPAEGSASSTASETDVWPCQDDVFTTLIQWLYGRIPYTRGPPAPSRLGIY